MTLAERINQDLKVAMKSRDQLRLNTIRSIRAQIVDLTKRGTGKDLTQEDELAAVKKRKEAIEMFEKGGRNDLVEQERRELEIISGYLPQQLSREEAQQVVRRIVEQTSAASPKDLGKVMPIAMKELKGKIDGKVIQELVRERLGG